MAYVLKLITDELQTIKGAEEFHQYLERFVFREENGDIYNGFGSFIRGEENIMFNFDLRSFTPNNRKLFWQATQMALTKFKSQSGHKNETVNNSLTDLLDMHKRIKKGEDPMLLNDLTIVAPEPYERLGPEW